MKKINVINKAKKYDAVVTKTTINHTDKSRVIAVVAPAGKLWKSIGSPLIKSTYNPTLDEKATDAYGHIVESMSQGLDFDEQE